MVEYERKAKECRESGETPEEPVSYLAIDPSFDAALGGAMNLEAWAENARRNGTNIRIVRPKEDSEKGS